MSSQTPEIADRTNRKRKDPAPSSQPDISTTKEHMDESDEDLADSDMTNPLQILAPVLVLPKGASVYN